MDRERLRIVNLDGNKAAATPVLKLQWRCPDCNTLNEQRAGDVNLNEMIACCDKCASEIYLVVRDINGNVIHGVDFDKES